MNFLLNEVWDFPGHYKKLKGPSAANATPEMLQMVITEMSKFCTDILAPLRETADKEGCTWKGPHEVTTPTGFKEAYNWWYEGGWQGLIVPEKFGGQGLPMTFGIIRGDMAGTANWTWTMYPGLSQGAINTLAHHASEALQTKYLTRLVTGEWTGTMCLTEPQCGSDLGQVKTSAAAQPDGSYKINGTKIFISCGEHDLTDNILHCVLARLPGAPAGTKGISLFLVPKRHVAEDGSLGTFNGVNIGRIENKMGCHGSSTCEINFEDAQGWLIGEANKGMNHMFTFINTSRVGTAIQGVAAAELSYQQALPYAKERCSMRALSGTKNPAGVADPLIYHPDVRKMLLTQKVFAEGGRSMLYQCGLVADRLEDAQATGDKVAAQTADDKLGLITPILKGFLSERGVEAANLGMQIWGGHGYIKENKMEQIFRDVRIAALWEGTTGIQALDLLGRKILMSKKPLVPLINHVKDVFPEVVNMFREGSPVPDAHIRKHSAILLGYLSKWVFETGLIAINARQDKESVGVASVDYLMYSGYITLAHNWLKMEHAAAKGLAQGGAQSADFYRSKIATSRFFFENILPRAGSHRTIMHAPVDSVMKMKPEHFSSDY